MAYADEVLADSPLAYWRLGEASGTTLTDSSGNGRNGSYIGSPTLGTSGLLIGDPNTCVDFDGVDDRADIPYGSSWMAPEVFTVEALINLDTLVGSILARRSGTQPGHAWEFLVNGGKLNLTLLHSGGAGYTEFISNATLSAGVTYHVVAAYGGTEVRLYINGVLDKAQSHTYGYTRATAAFMRIGGYDDAGTHVRKTNGRIDEVAFYASALSATRVAAHYTAATTSTSPVAVAGSAANVAVTARVGTPVTPVAVSGAVASVAVTAHPGAAVSGALPVQVAGSTANVTVTAQPGTPTISAAVVETSTEYANDGYNYDGMAAVYNDPPIEPTPPHIPRAKVMQVHQSMSAPVLVNGRPT